MRHRMPFPPVTVQPEPAVHREDHPVQATTKLAVTRSCISRHAGVLGSHATAYEQASKPSEVAGASAGAEPKKIAHWIGHAIGCVTFADQPPAVAVPKVMVTPVVTRMLSALMSVVYALLS